MSTPAPAYRGPDTSIAPRAGMELSDWRFANRIVAMLALLMWGFNQLGHGVAVRDGPQYVCLSEGPSQSAQALGATDQGNITGEMSFLPPTFFCGYPHRDAGQPPVVVDMYPLGQWLFWISLLILALTAVFALVLRRRARS